MQGSDHLRPDYWKGVLYGHANSQALTLGENAHFKQSTSISIMYGKASCVDEGGSKEGVIVVAVPMIEELGRTTGIELTPSTSIGSDELGTTATGEAGSELLMMTKLG